MVQRNVYMKNFPVISVKVFEGVLTRVTGSLSPTGGVNEGVAYYAAQVEKGDVVKLKDHSTNGLILVEIHTPGNEANYAHGIAVSDPMGIDNTTVSGQQPAASLYRTVDVAFFGLGVIELTASATGAVAPGDLVGLDEDEQNEVETKTVYGSVDVTANGSMIALSYAAAGSKVSLLLGATCFFDAD
jgi:hypothetical protein